jgi:hypothetical protein
MLHEHIEHICCKQKRQHSRALIYRPLNAHARVLAKTSPVWGCDGQSGIRTNFSPIAYVCPSQYLPTNTQYSIVKLLLTLHNPTN